MPQFLLERYILDAIAVAPNDAYDKKASGQSLHIETSIGSAQHNTDPCRFMLRLEVKVGPDENKRLPPPAYTVMIRGRAFFAFKEIPTKDEADRFLQLNGASILYGLLRGHVAQITAQGPHGQFLLPTLNFLELQKQAAVKRAEIKTKGQSRKRRKPLSDK
jgi:preprotein translocase subunit SecB